MSTPVNPNLPTADLALAVGVFEELSAMSQRKANLHRRVRNGCIAGALIIGAGLGLATLTDHSPSENVGIAIAVTEGTFAGVGLGAELGRRTSENSANSDQLTAADTRKLIPS